MGWLCTGILAYILVADPNFCFAAFFDVAAVMSLPSELTGPHCLYRNASLMRRCTVIDVRAQGTDVCGTGGLRLSDKYDRIVPAQMPDDDLRYVAYPSSARPASSSHSVAMTQMLGRPLGSKAARSDSLHGACKAKT